MVEPRPLLIRGNTFVVDPTMKYSVQGSPRRLNTTLPGVRTPLISELQSKYNMTCKLEVGDRKRLTVLPLSAVRDRHQSTEALQKGTPLAPPNSMSGPRTGNQSNTRGKLTHLTGYDWESKQKSFNSTIPQAPDIQYKNMYYNADNPPVDTEPFIRGHTNLSKLETRVNHKHLVEREPTYPTYRLHKTGANSLYRPRQTQGGNSNSSDFLYSHIKKSIDNMKQTTHKQARPLKAERGKYRPHSKTRIPSGNRTVTGADDMFDHKAGNETYKSYKSAEAYKHYLGLVSDIKPPTTAYKLEVPFSNKRLQHTCTPLSGLSHLWGPGQAARENRPVTSEYSNAILNVIQCNRPTTRSTAIKE